MSHNNNKKSELEKALISGYKEMADIELEIAQSCLEADNECLSHYEEKLTECE